MLYVGFSRRLVPTIFSIVKAFRKLSLVVEAPSRIHKRTGILRTGRYQDGDCEPTRCQHVHKVGAFLVRSLDSRIAPCRQRTNGRHEKEEGLTCLAKLNQSIFDPSKSRLNANR
jgi:hypothetical protein